MKHDYLLEVGCENLPSGYLAGALDQLGRIFPEGLGAERIACERVRVLGTPNRLVVHAMGIAAKQGATEERIIGPPAKIGLTEDGRYTRAAEGFANAQGIPVDKLSTVETERGRYLAVRKRIRGRATAAVLRERIPEWLAGVKFPKTMHWNESGALFARPVRWIVSMLGERVLSFEYGSISAGKETRLSVYRESSVRVSSVRAYFDLMERNGVILDPLERRRTVVETARRKAKDAGGRLVEDEELADVVANLLESPVALAGSFEESFLALPREVIVTALKSHQRYFSVESEQGTLASHFVAFADGLERNKREVLKGYERVLHARLADARFYFREDTARPLEAMARKLDQIVWLEGMGTLAQKTERIEALARSLRQRVDPGEGSEAPRLTRAARLAKADLASEMVKDGKEFTQLQGYIGREYALASGEDPEVAEAIFEHYLPRFAGDELPRSTTGTILAVADKLDTITGCFAAGVEPSGSQDPYALRRHALGVLRIAVEKRLPLPLHEAIEETIALYAGESLVERGSAANLAARISGFFTLRLNVMLRSSGFDHDLVSAVLASPWEVPSAVRDMAAELQRMRKGGELADLALAMKRIANIIPRGVKETIQHERRHVRVGILESFAEKRDEELGFHSARFSENAEMLLYDAFSEAAKRMIELEHSGNLGGSFRALAGLVPAINRYFEDVLVNAEEVDIRNNRIAFLSSSYRFIALYCDFSAISGE